MRAVCNTETFGKKLALVSRGVSARTTIQLLGGILLEASSEVVRLSATDMEISVQTSSPAEAEYERLLPTSLEREICVNREDLIGTLRRVNLFAQRETPPVPVSLSFSEGSVEVIVRNGEIGEAHERLPATSEDEFLISFNPSYLLDGVSAIDTEKVVFKFNEPLKPGLIVPGTDSEPEEEPDF